MTISLSIAAATILSFVAWLLFSHNKKINRPSYTSDKTKRSLTNLDAMLNNLTDEEKEPEAEINEKQENEIEKPEHAHLHKEDENAENLKESNSSSYKPNSDKRTNNQIDLQQAVIGSTLLNRRPKRF